MIKINIIRRHQYRNDGRTDVTQSQFYYINSNQYNIKCAYVNGVYFFRNYPYWSDVMRKHYDNFAGGYAIKHDNY